MIVTRDGIRIDLSRMDEKHREELAVWSLTTSRQVSHVPPFREAMDEIIAARQRALETQET